MKDCYGCGHQVHEDAKFCPSCGAPNQPTKRKIEALPSLKNSNNPFYWMGTVFKRCAFIEGRASRKEYFLGVLPLEIVENILLILLLKTVISGKISIGGGFILILFILLVTAVLFTASYIRRLHDIGRSGWELLVMWAFFIPAATLDAAMTFKWIYGTPSTVAIMWLLYALRAVVGLWIFVLMFKKGYSKENRFGPQPII